MTIRRGRAASGLHDVRSLTVGARRCHAVTSLHALKKHWRRVLFGEHADRREDLLSTLIIVWLPFTACMYPCFVYISSLSLYQQPHTTCVQAPAVANLVPGVMGSKLGALRGAELKERIDTWDKDYLSDLLGIPVMIEVGANGERCVWCGITFGSVETIGYR